MIDRDDKNDVEGMRVSEELNASLSALMDGEVDDAERQLSTDALLADAQLLGRWQRYHLLRSVLQQSAAADLPDVDLNAAVRLRAALDVEPAYAVAVDELANADNVVLLPRREKPPARPMRRALIGVAAAMGAGVIAWFAIGNGLSGNAFGGSSLTANTAKALPMREATASGSAGDVVQVSYPDTAMSEAEAQRVQRYMFLHAQQARMNHASQAMPFAKVVSFETP